MSQAEIDAARSRVQDAETDTAEALHALSAFEQSLAEGGATPVLGRDPQARLNTLRSDLAGAQQAETNAVDDLQRLVQNTLAAPIGAEVQALSEAPLVLFPVRLETRFALDRRDPVLRIRVYPDEIVANDFEPQLTDDEASEGSLYVERRASAPRDAWNALARRFGAERAAYIAAVADAPDAPRRPESWNRAVRASLLPDRWIAVGYPKGGGERLVAASVAIREPLAMSPNPSADDADVGEDGTDEAARWMADYDAALAAGMAIDLPLGSIDTDSFQGFDRLVVLGVKASLSAADTATELVRLWEAHCFGRGLELVAQGTPTNDTADRPSGYPARDSGDRAFERLQSSRDDEANDASLLLSALGIDPARTVPWCRAVGAGSEQRAALEMQMALWPATWGFYLRVMMQEGGESVFDDESITRALSLFVRHVRGRGPLPAFRVGDTPYGVLPISQLRTWTGPDSLDQSLAPALRSLRDSLLPAIEQVPRIGQFPDEPDAELVRILALHPSAREVRVRRVVGESAWHNLSTLFRRDSAAWRAAQKLRATRVFDRVGKRGWHTRVTRSVPWDRSPRFAGPLVAPEPLSETEGPAATDFDYLQFLGTTSPERLRDDEETLRSEGVEPPKNLLYAVLRHAMLTEYERLTWDYVQATSPADRTGFREILRSRRQDAKTLWDHLAAPVRSGESLATWLMGDDASERLPEAPTVERPTFLRQACIALGGYSDAELDRLFSEGLDVCSHRIDAWITALYARRLSDLRSEPRGSHVGAYGWVEDLVPAEPAQVVEQPDGRRLRVDPDGGGYVHAPSMSQASAAAVLRSAYLTHRDDKRYDLDLTSDRVREGRRLCDGIREGQSLADLLGYRFERELRERRLGRFLAPFRARFPLPGRSSTDARNVVNGLALRSAARQGDPISDLTVSPPPTTAERSALEAAIDHLDELADGASDLLTAESVHQLVRGNTPAAAATLEAVGSGARPPALSVAQPPRGGTPVTHRMLWWSSNDTLHPLWSSAKPSPRASAEPILDHWIGEFLGNPAAILAWTEHNGTRRRVTLADLGLRPVDALTLVRSPSDPSTALERRILDASYGDAVPEGARVSFEPAEDDSFDPLTDRTFLEFLPAAVSISNVLSRTRPLESNDLTALDGSDDSGTASLIDPEVLVARDALEALEQTLESLRAAEQAEGIRSALREAALFRPEAFPRPAAASEAGTQAVSVERELDGAVTRARALLSKGDAPGVFREVFGQAFVRLPRFSLGDERAMLGDIEARSTQLLAGDPTAAKRVERQIARVRDGARAWSKAARHASAVTLDGGPGRVRPRLDVAQLPAIPDEGWAGGKSPEPPAGSRLSLMVYRNRGEVHPQVGDQVAGLVIDEWVEVWPNRDEQTGLALHHQSPSAEAPQTILVAVRPNPTRAWMFTELLGAVEETLDLAKLRGLESSQLEGLGHVLPAMYLAKTTTDEIDGKPADGVNTRLDGRLKGETIIRGQS